MATQPTFDPDPLGLIADTEGIAMPLHDWRGIAKLGLPYDQVVRLYGDPPKAVQHLFHTVTKQRATAAPHRGQTRASRIPRRPATRA
jgi:hypothetical protein